jgi:hypothetical protein
MISGKYSIFPLHGRPGLLVTGMDNLDERARDKSCVKCLFSSLVVDRWA